MKMNQTEIEKIGKFKTIYDKLINITIGFFEFYEIVNLTNIEIWEYVLNSSVFNIPVGNVFKVDDVLQCRQAYEKVKNKQSLLEEDLIKKLLRLKNIDKKLAYDISNILLLDEHITPKYYPRVIHFKKSLILKKDRLVCLQTEDVTTDSVYSTHTISQQVYSEYYVDLINRIYSTGASWDVGGVDDRGLEKFQEYFKLKLPKYLKDMLWLYCESEDRKETKFLDRGKLKDNIIHTLKNTLPDFNIS